MMSDWLSPNQPYITDPSIHQKSNKKRSEYKPRDMMQKLGVLVLIIFLLYGCQDKELDFCEMLALDQSHVNLDTTDIAKQKEDRTIRKELIKNNFKKLIQYSKNYGFPEMGRLDATGLDSCRNWAVFITCFHIGQIAPHLFFEDETMDILTREIEKGNLKSSSLFTSFREGFRSHEFCISQKDVIYDALETWKIDIDELPKVKFKNCLDEQK